MHDPVLPPPRNPQPASVEKKRNGWLIGCGGCLLSLLLMNVLGVLAVHWAKKQVMDAPFAPVALSAEAEGQAREKLRRFNLETEAGELQGSFRLPAEPFVITESEVNYWISRYGKELSDAVRVDFEPGGVSVELRPGLSDTERFALQAAVEIPPDGNLENIRLKDLKIGGFTLPKSLWEEIEKQNMEFSIDPELQQAVESRIERIEFEQDQLRIFPRPPRP